MSLVMSRGLVHEGRKPAFWVGTGNGQALLPTRLLVLTAQDWLAMEVLARLKAAPDGAVLSPRNKWVDILT